MVDTRGEQRRSASYRNEVKARLGEAARNRAPLELIFTVRGRVDPMPGKEGEWWQLQSRGGDVVTFRPEFVLAFNGMRPGHRGRYTSPR